MEVPPGRRIRALIRALLAAALCGLSLPLAAQSLAASAAVSAAETEMGVPFTLQVAVDGSDTAPQVELPALDGVSVRQVSAGPNNSESITIAGGQTTRRVTRGYLVNYELIASRAGRLEIPSIGVTVDGQRLSTQPLAVTIFTPQPIEEYRLLVEAAADRAWVGQPVTLTTTWMWQEGLGPQRLLSFSHPVMSAGDADVVIQRGHPPGDGVELTVHGTKLTAASRALRRDGKAHVALVFQMIVVPREPGRLEVPAATVSFEGIASFRTGRDVFGRTVRDIRRLIVSSEPLALTVDPLPAAGRPDDFSGLVGTFEIAATATPAVAKVGDPIALEVTVRGSGDLSALAELDLAHLHAAGDFRVAAQRVERAGRYPSRATFGTTVRALHESVSAIPPVRLSYFDPQRGTYVEATSAPVALDVQPARQVTLRDVEGGALPEDADQGLAAAAAGIAHNYEGERLLRRQRFDTAAFVGSPGGVLLLAAGPLAAGSRRPLDAPAAPGRGGAGRARRPGAPAADDRRCGRRCGGDRGGAARLPARASGHERYARKRAADAGPRRARRRIRAGGRAAGDAGADRRRALRGDDRCGPGDRRPHPAVGGGGGPDPGSREWVVTRVRRAAPLLLALAVAAGAVSQEPAGDAMDAGVLLREAADLYRQADQLDTAGQSAAAAEALRGALLRYERVGSETGWSNGRLAYNAANTHLRLGDVGRAVLLYRRAAELMPGDRNVRQGLAYARRLRADRIDEPVSAGLLRVVLFWHYLLPTRTRAIAFVALWCAVWAGVLLRMLAPVVRRQRWLRPAGAACVLLAAAVAGSLAAELIEASTPPGVITAASVVARQGDGHSYEPSFASALHGGTEFRLLEDRGEWWHIRLVDGRETWIAAGAGELIR